MSLVNQANIRNLRKAISEGAVKGSFAPAVFIVEPTSRCKLNCIMCPNSRLGEGLLGDAMLEDLEVVFHKIAPYAELTMLYFMGEATLHPQFSDVLRAARRILRGRIVLSTSGHDVSVDKLHAIVSNVDLVIYCIDRWVPKAYEDIRRGSNFTAVVQTGETLLRLKDELKSDTRIVVKALDITLPREGERDRDQEHAAFSAYWSERGAIPLGGWLNSWAGQMRNIVRLSSGASPYADAVRVPCADLWFKMVVNWQGRSVLCCHNWDYSVKVGDMLASTVTDIWQSDALVQERQQQVRQEFAADSICRSCREWGEPSELDSYLSLDYEDLYQVF